MPLTLSALLFVEAAQDDLRSMSRHILCEFPFQPSSAAYHAAPLLLKWQMDEAAAYDEWLAAERASQVALARAQTETTVKRRMERIQRKNAPAITARLTEAGAAHVHATTATVAGVAAIAREEARRKRAQTLAALRRGAAAGATSSHVTAAMLGVHPAISGTREALAVSDGAGESPAVDDVTDEIRDVDEENAWDAEGSDHSRGRSPASQGSTGWG